MHYLRERAAYLKGLADGMQLNEASNEGKLLKAIISVIEDIAASIDDIENEQEQLLDQVDEIDEDLAELEEEVFGEENDDENDFDNDEFEDEDDECPDYEDEDVDEDEDDDSDTADDEGDDDLDDGNAQSKSGIRVVHGGKNRKASEKARSKGTISRVKAGENEEEEEGLFETEIECPFCKEIIKISEDMLDEDTNAVECPECHNKISLDCDCGCDCESCGGSADGDSDSKKDK